MSHCGSMKTQVAVTSDISELVVKHREEIEKSAGVTFTSFTPKEYSSQIVAGVNYFVVVEVDEISIQSNVGTW